MPAREYARRIRFLQTQRLARWLENRARATAGSMRIGGAGEQAGRRVGKEVIDWPGQKTLPQQLRHHRKVSILGIE